ncbi:glutaredoxin family protein [Myxococcota bacterium]|nr:glutaredoxin family protein [Myxococcota bacterium]
MKALLLAAALTWAPPSLADPTPTAPASLSAPAAQAPVEVELFTRPGCPHCQKARAWLEEQARAHPTLVLQIHDVQADPQARDRLEALSRQAGVELPGVPAIRVGEALIVGFSEQGQARHRVEQALRGEAQPGGVLAGEEPPPDDEGLCAVDQGCEEPAGPKPIHLPGLGAVDPAALGLPLFTVVLGLVDGFNPCAMWVLLFVLSLLVNLRDRVRMAVVGGTFVLVSGLVYFAFMAAWLKVFQLIGLSRAVQVMLGLVALFVATVNIKDFFAFKKGLSLTIPDAAKPGIASRARRILHARSLPAAALAAATLAILVNLVELLCTAGLPAVYAQVLASHALPAGHHYALLALYNLAYVVDDGLMLAVAVVTLSKTRLQERGGRALKLVSGLVMLALALALLLRPSLLTW